MLKSIIRLIRGSQRGFTLIELLAVMAVIGVLAGIVTTSVSGTGETSTVAQARSDASTVESSAGTYFTDQAATEVLTPKTVDVTAEIATGHPLIDSPVAFDTGAEELFVIQQKSSRWPEVYITENLDSDATALACVASAYCHEFPTTGLRTDAVVLSVIVADSDGAAITRATLLSGYTAVDFTTLTAAGYAASTPDTATQTADVNVNTDKDITVHNFLWLFKKSTSAGGSGEDDSRSVAVFKLANVQVTEGTLVADDTVTLFYAQIF
jgi:prepilin-type N-terminal cleavage/methylation domain-containing protein